MRQVYKIMIVFLIALCVSFPSVYAQEYTDAQKASLRDALKEQVTLVQGEWQRAEEYRQKFIADRASDIQVQEIIDWQKELKEEMVSLEEEIKMLEVE